MARLRGHAISSFLKADHTFVTCEGGYAWPCWGRKSGGHIITSGSGSSSRADCLSKPWSTAGIIYGITGVCHQTANRILWPAGIIVQKARGYWASSLVYGTYGVDIPLWLARVALCSSAAGEIPECVSGSGSKPGASAGADRRGRELARAIQRLYLADTREARRRRAARAEGPDLEALGAEMKEAMRFRLGESYRAGMFEAVQRAQRLLFEQRAPIERALYDRSLTAVQFAEEMNVAINRALENCLENLGAAVYRQLMDLQPQERIIVVDPEIAERAHAERP